MVDDDVRKLQQYFYQTHEIDDKDKSGRVLILGIGNYLMGDEGVGVHAIHSLSETELPDYVDLLDGGTGSFELMPILAQYPKVIFIDATIDGNQSGTVNTLYPKYAADFPTVLSAHDVGLKDMIDTLEIRGELPEIILITVSIEQIIPMVNELTKDVENSLLKVIEKVRENL